MEIQDGRKNPTRFNELGNLEKQCSKCFHFKEVNSDNFYLKPLKAICKNCISKIEKDKRNNKTKPSRHDNSIKIINDIIFRYCRYCSSWKEENKINFSLRDGKYRKQCKVCRQKRTYSINKEKINCLLKDGDMKIQQHISYNICAIILHINNKHQNIEKTTVQK
jgi:hypothetical protein